MGEHISQRRQTIGGMCDDGLVEDADLGRGEALFSSQDCFRFGILETFGRARHLDADLA